MTHSGPQLLLLMKLYIWLTLCIHSKLLYCITQHYYAHIIISQIYIDFDIIVTCNKYSVM